MEIKLYLTKEELDNIVNWLGNQGWEETFRIIEENNLQLNADNTENALFNLFQQLEGWLAE